MRSRTETGRREAAEAEKRRGEGGGIATDVMCCPRKSNAWNTSHNCGSETSARRTPARCFFNCARCAVFSRPHCGATRSDHHTSWRSCRT